MVPRPPSATRNRFISVLLDPIPTNERVSPFRHQHAGASVSDDLVVLEGSPTVLINEDPALARAVHEVPPQDLVTASAHLHPGFGILEDVVVLERPQPLRIHEHP
jgi:hypothetical protein